MPRYRVNYGGSVSAVVTVEAESPQAALDASWQELPGGLCHRCSRDFTVGDLEPLPDLDREDEGDLGAVTLDDEVETS